MPRGIFQKLPRCIHDPWTTKLLISEAFFILLS